MVKKWQILSKSHFSFSTKIILCEKMTRKSFSLWLFLIASVVCVADADLTTHFKRFLERKLGSGGSERFSRNDMGYFGGSFGGKSSDEDEIMNRPVVFLHGLTLRAGVFVPHRGYFLSQGYSEAELYATTYSDGGVTPFFTKTMDCEDVKQVREFFKAVYLYTNSTIDVIAYSMGVAISRKAILGGKCVDTGEYLGGPLTRFVHVYVAVAGVAYGYEACPSIYKACNDINGMACTSKYIENVNAYSIKYEGRYSYAIYSADDLLVGQQCCGHRCSELKNADAMVVKRGLDHVSILYQTRIIQYSLIRNQTLPPGEVAMENGESVIGGSNLGAEDALDESNVQSSLQSESGTRNTLKRMVHGLK